MPADGPTCPAISTFTGLLPLRVGLFLCAIIDLVAGLTALSDVIGVLPREVLPVSPASSVEQLVLICCGVAGVLGAQGAVESRAKLVLIYYCSRCGTMVVLVWISATMALSDSWVNPSVVYMYCLLRISYEFLATHISRRSYHLLTDGESEQFRLGQASVDQLQTWRESGGVLLQKS